MAGVPLTLLTERTVIFDQEPESKNAKTLTTSIELTSYHFDQCGDAMHRGLVDSFVLHRRGNWWK
jgi:hypothetical protein